MNVENHNKVIAYIEAHPEQWDQAYWHHPCKTAHCYAGIAQILSGKTYTKHEDVVDNTRVDAMDWLELTTYEASQAFHGINSLPVLKRLPDVFTYDEGGYNWLGYTKDGGFNPLAAWQTW